MSAADTPGSLRSAAISWDQFHRDCRELAGRLRGLGPFSALVAITRGGLAPAAVVARELSIRTVETVSIASYRDEHRQGDVIILKDVRPDFRANGGAGLLVVDDLVDTGQTVRALRAMLPRAHYATVYAKPQGRALIDTFVQEFSQDTWIFFPWDLGLSFQKPLLDEKAG